MSNMYEIYSKKIKENRVKAFISELRKRKFNICNYNECQSAQKDIVNLSYKIANQLDRPEELTDSEHVEAIDNFAINLGSCILRPSYLLNFGRWKGDKLIECDESNYMLFIVNLICDCDHLLDNDERIHYGEKIETIKKIFPPKDSYNNAA